MRIRGWKVLVIAGVSIGLVSCADGPPQGGMTTKKKTAAVTNAGKMGTLLKVLVAKAPTVQNAKKAMKGLLAVKVGKVAGNPKVLVDVLIKGNTGAAAKLKTLGVNVRTVTKSGIMTATVPLNKVNTIAAMAEVSRIEAGKRIKMYNDISNQAFAGCETGACLGMNNSRANQGAGVVVGVIDSGLDWSHGDFINNDDDGTPNNETTRIKYYWDQSDHDDGNVPAGFTYGHEYTEADFNAFLAGNANAILDSAKDTDGHGTHVTGTAAGDGSASGKMGVAPKAEIVFVKFDFDGNRNSDAAIIDGVNYIFQKAAALGKPAVINMSLGSDFGPHDGSTLEERGIDDLTGPGKIVVVAAGNPGNNNWGGLGWGFAMHGSAELGQDFTFKLSPYVASPDDYIFFDVWYEGGNNCRVQVVTPNLVTYPPSSRKYKNYWVTGSAYKGFSTSEGAISVGNGGDQLGWLTNNGDHEIYIEISDAGGVNPNDGEWRVKIVPTDASATCTGKYHVWFASSSSIIYGWRADPNRTPPMFNYVESNNAVTIGSPASATKVLAVAAYQTRNCWDYVYGTTDASCVGEVSSTPQCYGVSPIDYYDPLGMGELAYFSGRGPRRDGVLKPEIAAPGVGIASALSSHAVEGITDKCTSYFDPSGDGEYHYGTNRVLPGEKATVIQGTSMACPNATGAVALLLQADPTLDIDALRTLLAGSAKHDAITDNHENLINSAKTDTDTSAGPGQPNADWGHGKLDIDAALAQLGGTPPPPPPPECIEDGDCDDSNACTTDTCSSGVCSNTAAADGNLCSGGVCCAGACSAPACSADAQCNDNNDCTVDTCSGAGTCAAACSNTPVADGNLCSGGMCCAGTCSAPACSTDAQCNDGNECTTDICANPGTCSATCSNTASADNTTCSGGICCAGSCSAPSCSNNSQCNDGDGCTDDSCSSPNTCAASCSNVFNPTNAGCSCAGYREDCSNTPCCAGLSCHPRKKYCR